jgi:hypothetical protein
LRCCPTLPAEVTSSCSGLASEAINTECSQEVKALQGSGYCGSLPDASTSEAGRIDAQAHEAGATSDAAGDAGVVAPACALLGVCCQSPTLPASQTTTCDTFLASGDESQCATLLSSLAGSKECGSVGGTCAQLQPCCGSPSFPANDYAACIGAVNAGIGADCATQLSAYQQANVCAGDGGMATGACVLLDACCNSPMFPAGQQEACFGIARSNNASDCESSYTGYYAVGDC